MNTPPNREDRSSLIADLTDDLSPVRQFNGRDGAMWVAAAAIVTVIGVIMNKGLWQGMIEGEASPFFWVTNGLLLLLGLASASSVIAMASPNVGNRHDAPRWAAAMVGVLPLAALAVMISGKHSAHVIGQSVGIHCIESSLIAALVTAGALVLWLRRGAPVNANLTGWFTGLAAGALGTFLYGLSCPVDSVVHLGVSHIAPVAISALLGRAIVPFLIRW